MGYLKGCFASLRGLQQQIKNQRDHQLVTFWILACLVLHNLIIEIEHGIDDSDPFYIEILQEGRESPTDLDLALRGSDGIGEIDMHASTPGQRKHATLHNALLHYLGDI